MKDGLSELAELVREKLVPRRALIMSDREVDLSGKATNRIYVLELGTSSAAAGRAGGFGSRSASRIHRYECDGAEYNRILSISNDERLEEFELPFHASAVSLYLEDGSEEIASGVVDPQLVEEYDRFFGLT
jgi:hypothetical protein